MRLVIRGPGIPENQTRGQLVNNLDVVANIVELAGASPGATLDGHSLSPLSAESNAPWRSAIAFESPSAHFMGPAERYTGVRTATRKYIKFDTGVEMLYGLAAAPHESNSRTGNQPMPAMSPSCAASTKSLSPALAKPAGCREHWCQRRLVLRRSRHK